MTNEFVDPVAVTKLQPLATSNGALLRSSLIDDMQISDGRLALLSAPAGWGKSTLLAQLCERRAEEGRVVFVGLDRWDDDVARFWRALVAAFAMAGLDVGVQMPVAPSVTASGLLAALGPAVINTLATCDSRVTLALDDYHEITNAQVHEAVEYVVDHLPRHCQVVVATRYDPQLPIARLRAGGDLVEVRAADLALNEEETRELLRAVAGAELSTSDIALLHKRTEGWPAAVHLAGLALRGERDPSAAVADFHGERRHVADYLTGEVLARTSDSLRSFLMRCSILDRLEPGLCAAVTGETDAAAMLRQAEDLNLFLVPLDDVRSAYRFHRLFADWLHHQLSIESGELVPELHRRAMAWYLGQERPAEAIEQAIAGSHVQDARRLILEHGSKLIEAGHAATAARWLAALPYDVVASDPVLSIAAASTLATAGNPDRAEAYLEAAETSVAAGAPILVPLAPDVEIAAARATIAMIRRDLAGAVVLARRAAGLEIDPTRDRYGIGHAVLGAALFWTAEPAEARRVVERVWADVDTVFVKLLIAGVLAAACLESGDLERAETVARSALALAEERHVGPAAETALSHLALGGALVARGEPAGAEAMLLAGLEQSRWWQAPAQEAYGHMLLAQLRILQGDRDAARDLLRSAAPVVESARTMGILALTLRRTREMMRRSHGERSPGAAPVDITDRERDVLRLLPSQLTQREISRELYMSFNTVKSHTQSLYRKLGVSSRRAAVERARSLDLL
jgi:LuxR family maltose regulon positive regulatory protein